MRGSLGYRYTDYQIYPDELMRFYHNRDNENLFSLFLQDEIQLIFKKLWLTLEPKLEYSEIRDLDVQPSVRLLWAINETHKVWAAVSRAVRTPALLEMQADF